ncbi:SAM-dependent methyltransferase [Actinomadura sp. KC216]|uniref:SAM-dependent methyltransferase n=1 Tax=Actinomadura sp. KC216 TaxID=2530370 RepID=UPI001405272E|nr:SAM-dependent methyltransferase [Actinomadura sp. KC216]
MTLGPTPSLTGRSVPGPREDEADARGPLLNASAPGVARRCTTRPHNTFSGGEGTYAAGREPAERALRRCASAGRLVQAYRGILDIAAASHAQHTGLRRFPDHGCGLPAPAYHGHPAIHDHPAIHGHSANHGNLADHDHLTDLGGDAARAE